MFSGEYELGMDDKGRVFVPIRYREELGADLVMWRGFDGQLMVYPRGVWQMLVDALGEQQGLQRVREARQFIFSGIDVEMDKQGRVVVPPSLRRYAELANEITVLGNKDHLEIWSQIRWEERTKRLMTDGGDIAEYIAQLGVNLG